MDEATLDKIIGRLIYATRALEEALTADMDIPGTQLAESVPPPTLLDDENGLEIMRLLSRRLVGECLGREASISEMEEVSARMQAMLGDENEEAN